MTHELQIALADDSLLVREGIRQILDSEPHLHVAGVFADRDALLAGVANDPPDMVVTDIRMPPTYRDEGIEIANRLRESNPEIGVLVLSQYAEVPYALSLLRGGSARRGYLLKDRLAEREQLLAALETVAAGGTFVDPAIVDKLINSRSESRLAALTARELEILGLIASGRSNGAIATELAVTKRAVERHVNAIFAKLDLAEETEISRRVTAALVFLSEAGQGDGPGPGLRA